MLHKALWGIDWFMLADGDAATAISDAAAAQDRCGGRLQLLPRYHLENYSLDEHVLAAVFAHLEEPHNSWLREPTRIREALGELAIPLCALIAPSIAHGSESHLRTPIETFLMGTRECALYSLLGVLGLITGRFGLN